MWKGNGLSLDSQILRVMQELGGKERERERDAEQKKRFACIGIGEPLRNNSVNYLGTSRFSVAERETGH